MSIEKLNSFARDERNSELRALGAENVLMRYYLGGRLERVVSPVAQTEKPKSMAARVRHLLKEHGPMSVSSLRAGCGKCVAVALHDLKMHGQVRSRSRGVWELVTILLASAIWSVAQNVALLPPPLPVAPKGETFQLSWDASPSRVTEYRVYASTNRTNWKLVASTTNLTASVSNVIMPTWWVARAFDGTESTNSNVSLIGAAQVRYVPSGDRNANGTNYLLRFESAPTSEADAKQKNIVANTHQAIYASGSQAASSASMAAMDFGTTDPALTVSQSGFYAIFANASGITSSADTGHSVTFQVFSNTVTLGNSSLTYEMMDPGLTGMILPWAASLPVTYTDMIAGDSLTLKWQSGGTSWSATGAHLSIIRLR